MRYEWVENAAFELTASYSIAWHNVLIVLVVLKVLKVLKACADRIRGSVKCLIYSMKIYSMKIYSMIMYSMIMYSSVAVHYLVWLYHTAADAQTDLVRQQSISINSHFCSGTAVRRVWGTVQCWAQVLCYTHKHERLNAPTRPCFLSSRSV